MADDLTNIAIPSNEWADLYALSEVPVGTPLFVENIGSGDVYLAVQATKPASDHDAYSVVKRSDDIFYMNSSGDSGAWAFCNTRGGLLRISTTIPNGFNRSLRVLLNDGFGNPINSFRGAVDIHDSDVHSAAINHYVWRDLATYSLAADVAAGATQITLVDATGVVVGSDFHFDDSATDAHDHTFATVTAIAGNLVTINRPLDNAYLAASTVVTRINRNMTVTGTLAAPVKFRIRPTHGQVWHVTSISFSITDNDPMDDATFGGRPPLQNGVAVRYLDVVTGKYNTYSFWRKNADFYLDCFGPEYTTKAPSGSYGYRGKLFVKDSYGAVVRLSNTTEISELEVLIQDDLSTLQTFEITIHAHIEGG